MPRRGWSTLEVPAGWPQVIRGPHEALRKAQDERCKLEQELREGQQRLEELRAEASEQVREPPAAPAAGDEVSNLKKLVSELRGQVAVLEENRIDNWEGVEELRRLRREVENFRREAKTSELSTELAIPGPMNPSARMASLIDASDAKRRCVESTVR